MPTDPRDYHLDITGMPAGEDAGARTAPRPYLRVYFTCCAAYQHIYRAAGSDSYLGRCPRCHRQIKLLADDADAANHPHRRAV